MTAASADELKALLVVQEHDSALDALAHRRDTLDEIAQIAELEAAIDALDGQHVEISERRHELERSQKRLEDEVALLEDRIAREDAKLYGGEVQAVKELQALQDEITGLQERQRIVEDQIIEIMEAAEPVDAELDTVARQRADLTSALTGTTQRLTEARADIDAEIADVEGARAAVAAGINAGLLDEYARIRSRPGSVGVAQLVGRTCHGCHLELPAVEVDRLKKLPADALVHCEECGCILVR